MKTVYLDASGDLRLSANQDCWPAQAAMEQQVIAAVEREGARVKRAHAYNPTLKHGFLDSQRHGIETFRTIPANAPLIVAQAARQYTHHVLPGLTTHRGPTAQGCLRHSPRRPGRGKTMAIARNDVPIVHGRSRNAAELGARAERGVAKWS